MNVHAEPNAPQQQRVFVCSRQHTLRQLLVILAAEDPAAAEGMRRDIGRALQVRGDAAPDHLASTFMPVARQGQFLVWAPCCAAVLLAACLHMLMTALLVDVQHADAGITLGALAERLRDCREDLTFSLGIAMTAGDIG